MYPYDTVIQLIFKLFCYNFHYIIYVIKIYNIKNYRLNLSRFNSDFNTLKHHALYILRTLHTTHFDHQSYHAGYDSAKLGSYYSACRPNGSARRGNGSARRSNESARRGDHQSCGL